MDLLCKSWIVAIGFIRHLEIFKNLCDKSHRYRNNGGSNINPKSKALNSKQIQNLKFQCFKQSFAFVSLVFKNCLGFRILVLKFDCKNRGLNGPKD